MNKTATVTSHVSPWLASIVYPLGSYIIMPLFFGRIEIVGQENIPKTGPVILAPTHRSRWDAFTLCYSTGRMQSGRDLQFMVTIDEYNKPIQGWFIRRLGGFPIDARRLDYSSLAHSVELLNAGEMVVIFPEGAPGDRGEVYRDNIVHPLKRGLALVALEAESQKTGTGVKVVPIALKYSDPYPSWGSNIQVKIGTPLDVSDYTNYSLRKGSQKLTADLHSALKELYEKTESSNSIAMATV